MTTEPPAGTWALSFSGSGAVATGADRGRWTVAVAVSVPSETVVGESSWCRWPTLTADRSSVPSTVVDHQAIGVVDPCLPTGLHVDPVDLGDGQGHRHFGSVSLARTLMVTEPPGATLAVSLAGVGAVAPPGEPANTAHLPTRDITVGQGHGDVVTGKIDLFGIDGGGEGRAVIRADGHIPAVAGPGIGAAVAVDDHRVPARATVDPVCCRRPPLRRSSPVLP